MVAELLSLLERVDELLQRAQRLAAEGLGRDHWAYWDLWVVWQAVGWVAGKLRGYLELAERGEG